LFEERMTANQERRAKHRRFSDRRVHLLLAVHEILFDREVGPERDGLLVEEIRADFESDRAAIVSTSGGAGVRLAALAGEWDGVSPGSRLRGPGLTDLLQAHRLTGGAVTLTYTRRPSAFTTTGWEQLWSGDLGAPATALLSVPIAPQRADPGLLWLQQASYSREWGSQDRELAEEIAALLSRAADKALRGS
jgi:GAF domain-containing protein